MKNLKNVGKSETFRYFSKYTINIQLVTNSLGFGQLHFVITGVSKRDEI